MTDTLPCIICGHALENATPFEENQPSSGTTFASRGHYGSTVFDPMNGCAIQINLCDPCVRDRAAKGHILLYPASSRKGEQPEIWDGKKDWIGDD